VKTALDCARVSRLCREKARWQCYVSLGERDTLRYKTRAEAGYNAVIGHQREQKMKRVLAVLAFLVGGIATELAHPVQCLLVSPSRVQLKRQRQRSIDGNH
jgi:hypothetical protein